MKRIAVGIFIVIISATWLFAQGQAPDAAAGAPKSKGMVIHSDDSFLEPIQKRDSILIADQIRYGFRLKKVAEGTQLALPDFSKGFMDSVEVVSPWFADTVKVYGGRNEKKAFDIDVSLIITSFDEGRYELLPLSAVRTVTGSDRIDTLIFAPQVLEVKTMPIDTTTYKIHDIKGQIRYPLTFAEILPYILGIWGVAIIAILIWALLASRKKKESVAAVVKEPAHVIALRKLDHYRGDQYWAPEKQKIFYSGITDALREYISSRYGIDAMEMTSRELFKDLKETDVPADLQEEMKNLFETADYVKFAKALASDDENAKALPLAVRFVTTTYQEQLDEEANAKAETQKKEKGGAD
jgi:hypothetical protein